MNENIENRCIKFANYFLENDTTIRDLADEFNLGKTTVHLDLTKRLKEIDEELYKKVQEQLEYNKSIRHIRGGKSTKKYWEEKRKEKEESA